MQIMKDATQTMYAAGLVPAAHVHFGCRSAPDGRVLREDVLQQLGPAAARQVQSQVQTGDAALGTESSRQSEAANGEVQAPRQGAAQSSGQAKKPKWLKIGK